MFSILDIKNNKTDFNFFWWDFSKDNVSYATQQNNSTFRF